MRVLVLHNRYRQPGGEDAVVDAEVSLLRQHGFEVVRYERSNEFDGWASAVKTVVGSAWSRRSYQEVFELCRQFRPHVAHVHNFWAVLSPAVHAACRAAGAATVQTLHNYRLLCVNAFLLRKGVPCQDCLGRWPWRGVLRRCYRNSALASAAVAHLVIANRLRRTWDKDVDAFIALSEFARSRFVAAGLPADRIFVKPNFVVDPGPPTRKPSESRLVVFFGRWSEEKGVLVLLEAWRRLNPQWPWRLLIVGDGPLRASLESKLCASGWNGSVELMGYRTRPEVGELLQTARVVVVPSLWFENCPMVVLEALASGRPVIASGLGALQELVPNGVAGLTFAPGDADSLAQVLRTVFDDDALVDRMGSQARRTYLARYAAKSNLESLVRIYEAALARRAVSAETEPTAVPTGNSSWD
ncbi:MAG: glycosyltransferase family 4 protein [Bryobacterales bacterium]|nr:glycosyltransferase family 4 protein [Bryobacteraceae bacterium]MDW8355591.1 glycosyltransferase family 4 protein [Bryobacterales bacterium]